MGFNKNCTVCKGTGWMPKKGSPEDAETAKLFGLSVDELALQPCNADGKDMGCYQAENFNAEGYEVVQIFPDGYEQHISICDTVEEAKRDIQEFPAKYRHNGRLEIKKRAENFGGDPEGKLAKALERARKKAKQPRKPLKIERLKAESPQVDDEGMLGRIRKVRIVGIEDNNGKTDRNGNPIQDVYFYRDLLDNGEADWRIHYDSERAFLSRFKLDKRAAESFEDEEYAHGFGDYYEEDEEKWEHWDVYSIRHRVVDAILKMPTDKAWEYIIWIDSQDGACDEEEYVEFQTALANKDLKAALQNLIIERGYISGGWGTGIINELRDNNYYNDAESFEAEDGYECSHCGSHELRYVVYDNSENNGFFCMNCGDSPCGINEIDDKPCTCDMMEYGQYTWLGEMPRTQFPSFYDAKTVNSLKKQEQDKENERLRIVGSKKKLNAIRKAESFEAENEVDAEKFEASKYSVSLIEEEGIPDYYPYLAPEYTIVHGRGRYRFNRYGNDGMTGYQYRFSTKDAAIEWLCYQSHTYVRVKPNQPQYDFPPNTHESLIKRWYKSESYGAETRSLAKKSWDTLNNIETAVGTVGLAHMIGLGAIIGGGFAFLKGRKSNSKTEQ